jgi:hypothetical protein
MPPEAQLVKRIISYIDGRGGRCFKIVAEEGGRQESGIPDLLVCYRGFFVGIEAKTPAGKLRPRQRFVLASIEEAGGYTAVVRSLDEVEALLSEIDRKEVM